MIKIGKVEAVFKIRAGTIISVSVTSNFDIPLQKGVDIKFGGSDGSNRVDGIKWWRDESIVDVLFYKIFSVPQVGAPVFIIN